jgi:hypothetical protein
MLVGLKIPKMTRDSGEESSEAGNPAPTDGVTGEVALTLQ